MKARVGNPELLWLLALLFVVAMSGCALNQQSNIERCIKLDRTTEYTAEGGFGGGYTFRCEARK